MKSPASLIWISIREDSFREWHGRGKAYRHSSVIAGSIILGQLNHGELTRGISSSLKKTLHSGGIYSVDRLKGIEIPVAIWSKQACFIEWKMLMSYSWDFLFHEFSHDPLPLDLLAHGENVYRYGYHEIFFWNEFIESLVFLFPSLKMHNNLLCVQQKN